MEIRWIGAILIIASCAAVGVKMGASYIKQEKQLEQLLSSMHYIKCELQYRLTPLSQIVNQCYISTTGAIRYFYQNLLKELEAQINPNAQYCLNTALAKSNDLCPATITVLRRFGQTLGKFDLEGQLAGIDEASSLCCQTLEKLKKEQPIRIRNYQTLGLCAGAALVILFI